GKTLPLEDHEVVLTFDDGPLPKYSNQILAILAAHCAKATFFLVGRQANGNPEGVRKVRDAGHTVATHTQNHPVGMDRLPLERSIPEIEQGIASVTAALGDGSAPAPFVRIPGLRRNDGLEAYARSKGLQVWSADFPADDWRSISADRVYQLAMQRLEAKGKGILLLHDIQPRTVAALPRILHEMKARGYRIVHVVPATPGQPVTPTEPLQWQAHPASETVAVSRWPTVPAFAAAPASLLPAPALSHLDWRTSNLGLPRRARAGAAPRVLPWPGLEATLPVGTLAALPVPAASIFRLPESTRLTMLASSTRRTVPAANARSTEVSSARGATAATPRPANAKRNTRPDHVAGLKKR
ncbi:MAG: polysaccharide deacetylase family protein, partial [Bradyrhizobium sp.]